MKRREFLKTLGITAGSLFIPGQAYSLIKNKLEDNPVEGASLKFYKYPENDFIGEYITDSNGDYSWTTAVEPTVWRDIKLMIRDYVKDAKKISKTASNIMRVDITHPDYHNATRYIDTSKGKLETKITDKSFDMEFFDAWARGGKKVLRRWDANPKWYINTTNAKAEQVDLVEQIINDDLTEFSNGFVSADIEKTTEQKTDRGSIYVYWVEEGDYYGNHEETLENNEIVYATTWFSKSNKLRRIYLRQLTQVLGLLNNPSKKEFYSVDGYYTDQGMDIGKFLYSSKIGNSSPDIDPAPV